MGKVGSKKKGRARDEAGGGEGAAPRFDISVFRSWCKDCGICIEFCPKKVFDRDSSGGPVVARPGVCTGCQECVLHCPDFAVQVERKAAAARGGEG